MKAEVELRWVAAGRVSRDRAGKLVFPSSLRHEPAIYWFRLTGRGTTSHYIGEAEDLARRMAGYRAGYERQVTNFRMNARMLDHLASGGTIEMSTATSGRVLVDGAARPFDLGRKRTRLLAEAAALAAVPDGESIENQPGIGDRAG